MKFFTCGKYTAIECVGTTRIGSGFETVASGVGSRDRCLPKRLRHARLVILRIKPNEDFYVRDGPPKLSIQFEEGGLVFLRKMSTDMLDQRNLITDGCVLAGWNARPEFLDNDGITVSHRFEFVDDALK